MRRRFVMNVEPYTTLILGELKTLVVDSNGRISFTRSLLRNVAKSSGLKSNNTRKQKKRAKLVIHEALQHALKIYAESKL